MPALTPDERETIIIRDGRGNITISSNDPTRQKHLLKRLGKPDREERENMEWYRTTKDTTFTLPRPKVQKARPGARSSLTEPPSRFATIPKGSRHGKRN